MYFIIPFWHIVKQFSDVKRFNQEKCKSPGEMRKNDFVFEIFKKN